MELCAGFTCDQWRIELRPLLDGDDQTGWEKAVGVLERRMEERFFRCIDALLEKESACSNSEIIRPGFSIMALCCLLVETLQSFYEGGRQESRQVSTQDSAYTNGPCTKAPSTARAFKDFLGNSPYFNADFRNNEIRGDFAKNVRNGLLHEAETRHGWLIKRSDPPDHIFRKEPGGCVLNRSKFYHALREEFGAYLGRLRDPLKGDLRRNFLTKMDSICDTEPGIE
jgi:hypothetical protein